MTDPLFVDQEQVDVLAQYLANALEAIQLLHDANDELRARLKVCEIRLGLKPAPAVVMPEYAQRRVVELARKAVPAIGDLRRSDGALHRPNAKRPSRSPGIAARMEATERG